MDAEYFRQTQRSSAVNYLGSLFRACRSRFLNAASLLELRGPVFDKLRESAYENVDLWPLLGMFDVICDRYADEFFTPQEELFITPVDEQDAKWTRYFYNILIPHLVQDDGFVRNVLRAVMVIPCKSPRLAGDAIVQYIFEMTLPETVPAWAPEDCIYY